MPCRLKRRIEVDRVHFGIIDEETCEPVAANPTRGEVDAVLLVVLGD
jgi:hypothetical protein